ncbi:TPR-like protein [Glarea lozoyensis ATCC 20868]|uniref:TPR-like protein n=1 Tax=Glarea lozoyensis (strain ATCC 20868 / MF5171) TaxID=1116229 RepID=S3CH75_GLAL2|nr:TPR-like protein [Glarea lozoyensis ATCC 20868]EPE24649.1 TPR-like protein [Glarea lozoyensis ATCC 20868]
MACTKDTVKDVGLNIWSSQTGDSPAQTGYSPAPTVDIIAVQGLGSHPYYTWEAKSPRIMQVDGKSSQSKEVPSERKSRSTKFKTYFKIPTCSRRPTVTPEHVLTDANEGGHSRKCMWIRDLLVPLFPEARIATYSYKSDWRDRNIKTTLRECALLFLNVLKQNRGGEEERQRPIILIGHSLGCLVIQQALVIAASNRNFSELRQACAGLMFLGGPFQGSDLAIYGQWLAGIPGLDANLLSLLKKHNDALYHLQTDFCGAEEDWDPICYYEKQGNVVTMQSSSLQGRRMIPLNTDHSGLNKFNGENDENFLLVLPEIRRMVRDGSGIVKKRSKFQEPAPLKQRNIHWIVPRIVNKLFTGRDDLILRIQEALDPHTTMPTQQKRFVITGMGGQGKSEICLKVANLMQEKFWGVFWVNVDTPSTAKSDFIAIAKRLGHEVGEIREASQILANTKENWLLILDNADDTDFDYQVYIPTGFHGAILITSRNAESKRYSNLNAYEDLEGLESTDAKALLLQASDISQKLLATNDEAAQEILDLLGSHTLALIQAGAYISKKHCSLSEYPAVYKRLRKRLSEYRLKPGLSRYQSVYATFEASAEMLEHSTGDAGNDALALLAILSMFNSTGLPLYLFEGAWRGAALVFDPSKDGMPMIHYKLQDHLTFLPDLLSLDSEEWDGFRLNEAISTLVSLYLVTWQNANGERRLSMHPVAHAWAKDRQSTTQQRNSWLTAGCVVAFSYQDDFDFWRLNARYLRPHINSFLDMNAVHTLSFEEKKVVIPILMHCGFILSLIGDWGRLGDLVDNIFCELKLDSERPTEEALELYMIHGDRLSKLGDCEKAIQLFENILKSRETLLTTERRLVVQYRLATACLENNQAKEAIVLLEDIVVSQNSTLSEIDADSLTSRHELAHAYFMDNQVPRAISILEEIVWISADMLPETHPHLLSSCQLLGMAYHADGQINESISTLEHVVKVEATILLETDITRLLSQYELARVYHTAGQTERALELLEYVVKMQATTLAETDKSRLESQYELARVYHTAGQTERALELLEYVVKVKASILPETDKSRLSFQYELAYVYHISGQTERALELLEHVVTIEATILLETDKSRLKSQYELARVYHTAGQMERALELLKYVIQIERTIYESDDRNLILLEDLLAEWLEEKGAESQGEEE